MNIEEIINIKLPPPEELKNSTDEEKIYNETSEEAQGDHKKNQEIRLLQEKARVENNTLKIKNSNLENLAGHRIAYSWGLFGFVVLFMVSTLAVLLLSGKDNLTLSDTVLTVLLGTNMTQVIGVLYIVTKWLYPQKIENR